MGTLPLCPLFKYPGTRMGKRRRIISSIVIGGAVGAVFLLFREEKRIYDASLPKDVTLSIDGFPTPIENVTYTTVEELLDAHGTGLSSEDVVFPDRDAPISSGMRITVLRKKQLRIVADGEIRDVWTNVRSVEEALSEVGIGLREDDLVDPSLSTLLSERQSEISIIRVEIREESVEKAIVYETKTKEDDTLSWRKKTIERKGENGIRTNRYRVSYHDGKEVARKLIGSEVTKDPVSEILVQGTYVKTGKAERGLGTWYAHTGTLAAASLSLPLGSYAKVTNPANGKSVMVVINDRGPYGKGRIIDLDKVAFERIASIGAGVIDVKVEPVLN